MKIAIIISRFPAVSLTFVLNQITGLIDRGHEVDIYAEQPGIGTKIHADVTKYNLIHATHYYFQGKPFKNPLWFLNLVRVIIKFCCYYKNPKTLFKVLRSKRVEKFPVKTILYAAVSLSGKGPYDIIHCQFGRNGVLGAILRNIGVVKGKLVCTFHGHDISAYIKNYGNNAYRELFAKGDLFLPISEHFKRRLMELGCSEQKIFVHRMGINVNKFACSLHSYRNSSKVRLITIGRFIEKKGIQYALEAVAKAYKRTQSGIEYKLVGDGPLRRDLEELSKKLDIHNIVTFLGWREQDEVVKLLEDTDILLAPSVTAANGDQEGIPVVLMEAMAKGLPVISTQHSGIPELVQDGKSGFLVPERDADALAERLEYLIVHPELRARMGQEGRNHIEECYNIDTLNDRLVGLYKMILS